MDRVLEDHDGSVTYFVAPNFEVRDGIAVTYARVGERRIARMAQGKLQPALLPDLAHDPGTQARIDVGDAWLQTVHGRQLQRTLYASARRLLLEHAPGAIYLHQDYLGSTTLATGLGGGELGECGFRAGSEVEECRDGRDRYAFSGQRRDPTTRLLHFPFREFDARVARWISPDPKFLVDSSACLDRPFECANGYQYVLNNPVDFIDPTGEIRAVPGVDVFAVLIFSPAGYAGIAPNEEGDGWTLYGNGGTRASGLTWEEATRRLRQSKALRPLSWRDWRNWRVARELNQSNTIQLRFDPDDDALMEQFSLIMRTPVGSLAGRLYFLKSAGLVDDDTYQENLQSMREAQQALKEHDATKAQTLKTTWNGRAGGQH
ncbi:MAG: RHS repeat-associated core domain-containing protein [Myxococcales bacterium]